MINLFFEQNWNGQRFTIQASFRDKGSDIIKKYRIISNDYNRDNKFIFNGKELNIHLSVLDNRILGDSIINVIQSQLIFGSGYGINFIDVSKNKIKELEFSENAPSYRLVDKGINLCGICQFKKCLAFKEEVVIPIQGNKFDLIKDQGKLYCPECESLVKPKTVGFYLCRYRIYGKKYENGNVKSFENPIDEAKNENTVKYFDPDQNDDITFVELVFEVLNYF